MKETKEAVVGLLVLAKLISEVLKDGPQITDAIVLFEKLQAPEIKEKMDAALSNINLVESEVKAASLADYIELVAGILPELTDLIKSVQK